MACSETAGDVNGDGFDDLLVGAFAAFASGNAKPFAGESYVIFGGSSLPAVIDLAILGWPGSPFTEHIPKTLADWR